MSDEIVTYLQAGFRLNFPPEGFDPVNADDETLRKYYLPPRPLGKGEAFANWKTAMSGPLIWPKIPRCAQPRDALRKLFAQSPSRSARRCTSVLRKSVAGGRPRAVRPFSGIAHSPRARLPCPSRPGQQLPGPQRPRVHADNRALELAPERGRFLRGADGDSEVAQVALEREP